MDAAGKYPNTPTGALACINDREIYVPFPADCLFLRDPKVDGVWAVYHPGEKFGVMVNTITGEFVGSEFDIVHDEGVWPPLSRLVYRGRTFVLEKA